jgi:hypothetical protein
MFPVAILAAAHWISRDVPIDDLMTRFQIYAVACVVLAVGYAGGLTLSGLSWRPDIFVQREEPAPAAPPETIG